MTNFSDRLKTVMEQAHMNQSDLSAVTGIGKSSISQYLSGKNEPQRGNMQKIADATGADIDFLLGYEVPTMKDVPPSVTRIGTRTAAKCLGKSEQFVRIGLQRGLLPFGNAVPGEGSKWNYYINPSKFRDYVGAERFNEFFGLTA